MRDFHAFLEVRERTEVAALGDQTAIATSTRRSALEKYPADDASTKHVAIERVARRHGGLRRDATHDRLTSSVTPDDEQFRHSCVHTSMWWLRPTEASIAIGQQRAGGRCAVATKPGLASRSRASRRSARVAPDGGDPAVSELDLMERSLRIERAARVRAEQAARHAKAAIATAETLREATVKAAAVHVEASMERQERLLKKQAELKRELEVISQICKDSEALAGESSYARQIGRLKARLHVTSAFRPPTLLALGRAAEPRGGQRERLRCGHEARPRSPMMRP